MEKVKEGTNEYSHFYLYAKGWYKRTNLFQDLKIILENYCGTSREYLNERDVIEFVASIVYPVLNQFTFTSLISESIAHYKRETVADIGGIFLVRLLSVMSTTELSKIKGGLSKPDYTILPQKEV